jgi:undecaprenyl-diphosphatase
MQFWEVLILSFVEGLTEFLPISSTGHLIITSAILGIAESPTVMSFNIIIQAGAILSVLYLYWNKFFPLRTRARFYLQLMCAFLPAAVIGILVKKKIDLVLQSPTIVAWALVLGGFVLIWSDKRWPDTPGLPNLQGPRKKEIADLSYQNCLLLGLIQCLAFIPGVSRAGATILGGLWLGLSRKEAAEFSFFLAVPTLTGAAAVKGWDALAHFSQDDLGQIGMGIVLSFLFATLAIKFFIRLVSTHGFKHFGVYRILLGSLILIFLSTGALT